MTPPGEDPHIVAYRKHLARTEPAQQTQIGQSEHGPVKAGVLVVSQQVVLVLDQAALSISITPDEAYRLANTIMDACIVAWGVRA